MTRVPGHGFGLSVDVYSPDVHALLDGLAAADLAVGYLEVFKASVSALAALRRRAPDVRMAYHGEGLWLTQPDWLSAYPAEIELETAASHLRALGSAWINHECASKQIAGYSFGTYLPPIFNRDAAVIAARHARYTQWRLDDRLGGPDGPGPLLLLELPPLTYFKAGDLSVAGFFKAIAEEAACGFVLDVGHLWTVYRYAADGGTATWPGFVRRFLDDFPLDRVVQVHVAGLGPGAGAEQAHRFRSSRGPLWIDAHDRPIPSMLLDALEIILEHPRVSHLRGVALEVDTKPVGEIVAEFSAFGKRYGARVEAQVQGRPPQREGRTGGVSGEHRRPVPRPGTDEVTRRALSRYRAYARGLCDRADGDVEQGAGSAEAAAFRDLYRRAYLPREILAWGGDLRDLFPETCRRLEAAAVPLVAFVDFWCRAPRPVSEPYDFFLLKLDRFVAFVQERLAEAGSVASREAADMRAAYLAACEPPACVVGGRA